MKQLSFACALWMIGCGGTATAPTATTGNRGAAACEYYDYRFAMSDDRATLSATLCFDGPPPAALVCSSARRWDAAPRAWRISSDVRTELPTSSCRVELQGLSAGDCVQYSIDLNALRPPYPVWSARDVDAAFVLEVGSFLLRPAGNTLPASVHGHATFDLPSGISESVPWERDADGYVFDKSAFTQAGYAAFGPMEREMIDVHGTRIEVSVLGAVSPATRAAIVPWITRLVQTSSQVDGRFVATRAQVLLVPQAGGGGVRFGMLGRGGGPSVLLHTGRDSTEAELVASWEPVHELAHLRTPLVHMTDRWLTEGIATYYQEVLRTRDGLATPAEGWTRLWTRLASAAQLGSGRTLHDECAAMSQTGEYRRVYWAGVALALLADVQLRTLPAPSSLDAVLTDIGACCTNDPRVWSAHELIARMDAASGTTVWRTLTDTHLHRSEFPDLSTVWHQLGVTATGDEVTLDPSAPLSNVRDAIMRPHPSLTDVR